MSDEIDLKASILQAVKEVADKVVLTDNEIQKLYLIHTAYKLDTTYRAFISVATSTYSCIMTEHPEKLREFSLKFAKLCASTLNSQMESVVDSLLEEEGRVN